jgi:hypothetical protein
MARAKQSVEKAKERLRLKSEQLNLRVRIDESKDKLRQVSAQLKTIGGRIR